MSWPHAICAPCFLQRNGVVMPSGSSEAFERCCWCGDFTGSGLFVRGGPAAGACVDPSHGDVAVSGVS